MCWQSGCLEDPVLILFLEFPAVGSGHRDWSERMWLFPAPDRINPKLRVPKLGPGSFPMNALCVLLTVQKVFNRVWKYEEKDRAEMITDF